MSLDGFGPKPARVMIIGDHPGADDEVKRMPFMGTAGFELSKMLHEVGILRHECYLTNILDFRPDAGDLEPLFDFKKKMPKSPLIPSYVTLLKRRIAEVNPTIIIALGGLACWVFSGDSAVSTWRGSLLSYEGIKVIPTYHPVQIMRNWEWRAMAIRDLRRVREEMETRDFNWRDHNFHIRPSADQALFLLGKLLSQAALGPLKLSVDLETRKPYIACLGIAWSELDAMCIPIMCTERTDGYFDEQEEHAVVLAIKALLTHPNVSCVGQNFLYDAQYFAKEWGYTPNLRHDTMLMQHVLFPGLPKGLDFLASMYCKKYVYWKNEGKEWDTSMPEDDYWVYNCKDACYTYEISEVLPEALAEAGLSEQYSFQMNLWWKVLRLMLRGVRIDLEYRKQLSSSLLQEIQSREQYLTQICGHPLNPRSPKQLARFFYEDLRLPVQRQRKGTRGITTDDEALTKLALLEPAIAAVCRTIREMRSLGVFLSTFVLAELGHDKRIRCSFNPAGTETFRFSSSKDAFDSGTNLQNIPKGNEEEEPELEAQKLILPNIRKLFIPDPGKIIVDVDLAGADAQVVAWEAEDDILKAIFRSGQKVHAINAKDIFGGDAGPDGKREPYYSRAKLGCHLTNYGGKARTLATGLGMLVREAEEFQARWFDIHPGIKEWQEYIENELATKRCVTNKFGYRRFYFDRIDNLLGQALAWIPQSTVAIVTNTQFVAIEDSMPEIGVLLQVHDSLVFQVDKWRWKHSKANLREKLKVVVPYSDPLIIGSGLKTSEKSWGDAENESWE